MSTTEFCVVCHKLPRHKPRRGPASPACIECRDEWNRLNATARQRKHRAGPLAEPPAPVRRVDDDVEWLELTPRPRGYGEYTNEPYGDCKHVSSRPAASGGEDIRYPLAYADGEDVRCLLCGRDLGNLPTAKARAPVLSTQACGVAVGQPRARLAAQDLTAAHLRRRARLVVGAGYGRPRSKTVTA